MVMSEDLHTHTLTHNYGKVRMVDVMVSIICSLHSHKVHASNIHLYGHVYLNEEGHRANDMSQETVRKVTVDSIHAFTDTYTCT